MKLLKFWNIIGSDGKLYRVEKYEVPTTASMPGLTIPSTKMVWLVPGLRGEMWTVPGGYWEVGGVRIKQPDEGE